MAHSTPLRIVFLLGKHRVAVLGLLLLNACGSASAPAPAASPAVYAREPAQASAAPPPAAPDTESSADAAPASIAAPASMSAARAPSAPLGAKVGAPAPGTVPAGAGANADAARTKASASAEATAPSTLLIYTGDLSMLAEEEQVASTIDKTIDVAESVGGYLATRKDTSVMVRVPSARFRDAMTKIEALGAVTHRSVGAEDVSEEFHDAEVRLQNLRATRQRMQEFLAKANSMQDALTVERELERVALEIDRLEGRMRFLKARAAFSQITLTVAAKPKVRPIVASTATPKGPTAAPEIALPVGWLDQLGAHNVLQLK
jgi:hypothetical protein